MAPVIAPSGTWSLWAYTAAGALSLAVTSHQLLAEDSNDIVRFSFGFRKSCIAWCDVSVLCNAGKLH